MYRKNDDPRVVRSREWIHEALLQLIEHTKLEEITIQSLVQKAGVSRSTFYRNYDSVEAVLHDMIDVKVNIFILQLDQASYDKDDFPLSLMSSAIAYWTKEYRLIDALTHSDKMHWLADKLYEYTKTEMTHQDIFEDLEEMEAHYIKRMGHSMLLTLLLEWIKHGRKESNEQLIAVMKRFLYMLT